MVVKIQNVDVNKVLEEARQIFKKEPNLSESAKVLINMLIWVITTLVERFMKNSTNSSKPPSTDQKGKGKKREKGGKPGGQNGHAGSTLTPVDKPDEIVELHIPEQDLPKNENLKKV